MPLLIPRPQLARRLHVFSTIQRCSYSMMEQTLHTYSTSYFDLGTASDVFLPGAPPAPGHKAFPYEGLYQSIIDTKKSDKSYRYFRSITRLQNEFPFAECSRTGKKINVWCSNDYVRAMNMCNGLF